MKKERIGGVTLGQQMIWSCGSFVWLGHVEVYRSERHGEDAVGHEILLLAIASLLLRR